jgi:phospholipid/cholesterol/gamma-HCH transport system permease protein
MSFPQTMSRPLRGPYRLARRTYDGLSELGEQLLFYGSVVRWVPRAIRRYRNEVLRLLAEVSLGTGSLAIVAGTVGIIVFLTVSTGAVVGLAGYEALRTVGTEAYLGFISAYFNTREVAPLIAGIALSATVGCGFTAQLGAMRINEEVDALEVMGIPSVPYLVTTRVIAAFIAVIPLYVIALMGSYVATEAVGTIYYHQSPGTYAHYFTLFLPPVDIIYSFAKVMVFALIVVLVHCYYGYTAKGGPVGVGVAVGRAVRLTIVAINVVDFFLSLAIWGSTTTIHLAG